MQRGGPDRTPYGIARRRRTSLPPVRYSRNMRRPIRNADDLALPVVPGRHLSNLAHFRTRRNRCCRVARGRQYVLGKTEYGTEVPPVRFGRAVACMFAHAGRVGWKIHSNAGRWVHASVAAEHHPLGPGRQDVLACETLGHITTRVKVALHALKYSSTSASSQAAQRGESMKCFGNRPAFSRL